MNKKLTTSDSFPIGVGNYVSPAVAVSEISNEGVLCASSGSLQTFEEVEGLQGW